MFYSKIGHDEDNTEDNRLYFQLVKNESLSRK